MNGIDAKPTAGQRLRAWPALAVMVGWTVFLWLSRVRNVVSNDDLNSFGVAWRLGVVVVFLALAGLAIKGRLIAAFVVWTIGYWFLRGGGILISAEYDAAFKAIHTVLMVVSIGAAMWVWRTRPR